MNAYNKEQLKQVMAQAIQNNSLPFKWMLKIANAESKKQLTKIVNKIDRKLKKRANKLPQVTGFQSKSN